MEILTQALVGAAVTLIGIGVRWVEKRALRKKGQLIDKEPENK